MQKEPMSQPNMFTKEMQLAISKLDAGQLEHFYFMSCALLDCYTVDCKRAAVVIHDEHAGETKMIAVNADQLEVSNILNEITGLMNAQIDSSKQPSTQIN